MAVLTKKSAEQGHQSPLRWPNDTLRPTKPKMVFKASRGANPNELPENARERQGKLGRERRVWCWSKGRKNVEDEHSGGHHQNT